MKHQIFIPYFERAPLFEYHEPSGLTFISQEFWNWAEDRFSNVGRFTRWDVVPETISINYQWEHGRIFKFQNSSDAMLFKLTWALGVYLMLDENAD